MKKGLALFTALTMLCSMAVGMAEGSYLSIQELIKTTPARWQKTFETKWREVEINADIIIPEVEKLPVVRVSGGATEPALTAEEAGWDSIQYRSTYDLILSNEGKSYPKRVDGVRVGNPTSKGSWYGDFDLQNTYVPMDDITLGEIIAMARERVAILGYDPDDFAWESPLHIWAHHVYAAGTKEDILPGYIFMEVSPKIAGIPVISHIYKAVMGQSTSRTDELILIPESSLGYDGYDGAFSHIFLKPLKVAETLADDIPLRSFDKVLAAIEKEINAGHIRKIYEIKLGYVIYNPPGVYRQKGERLEESELSYYAKPMWQVNCLYANSASGNLQNTSDFTDDERNSLNYRQLLIDTQTG